MFLEENLALVVQLLQPFAHDLLVARIRRADEMGRRHAEAFMQPLKMGAHLVGEKLRLDSLALRRLLHLLPVLIDAGQKKHVVLEALLMRAKKSASTFSYACPRCGALLT